MVSPAAARRRLATYAANRGELRSLVCERFPILVAKLHGGSPDGEFVIRGFRFGEPDG